MTEKEIFNGILNAENVANNVILFIREIEDVKDYIEIDKSIAWRYIDVDEENKIDEQAQALLTDLTMKKIPAKLPETNTFRFKVKWAKGKGITQETHPEYMKEFGELFYEQTKKLIDRNQTQESLFEKLDKRDTELLKEVLKHAYFCTQSVERFHGREDLLGQVSGHQSTFYLKSSFCLLDRYSLNLYFQDEELSNE